ncbi:MAG TPA: sigma 54-interacting transcriptional regulator [Candidatus Krumholzibacteria bacterium]|nr:sigma 54-interacting transcriptional regulator [Candidatus Krumholzibacteria bacterium]
MPEVTLHHSRPRTRLALRRGLETAGFDVRVIAQPAEAAGETAVLLIDTGSEAFLDALRTGRIRPARVMVLGAPTDPLPGAEILPADTGPAELVEHLQGPPESSAPPATSRAEPVHAGGLTEVEVRIERLAPVDLPVLVTGESGTGKEVVARALHDRGPRADDAFVVIDASAVPDDLVESELFGHVRGAFTDAVRDRPGRLAQAGAGTLVLDEVGELPLPVQARLLRVLQERSFQPVGGTEHVPLRARVLAITQRDLGHEITHGRFREDLYHRLAGATIRVPPLRERPEDLPVLARQLLARAGEPVPALTAGAVEALRAHAWPGNVRELDHVLQRCRLSASDTIDADLVRSALREAPTPSSDDVFARALRTWIGTRRSEGESRSTSERALHELFDRIWDEDSE